MRQSKSAFVPLVCVSFALAAILYAIFATA
jgi:hypothetical protein